MQKRCKLRGALKRALKRADPCACNHHCRGPAGARGGIGPTGMDTTEDTTSRSPIVKLDKKGKARALAAAALHGPGVQTSRASEDDTQLVGSTDTTSLHVAQGVGLCARSGDSPPRLPKPRHRNPRRAVSD